MGKFYLIGEHLSHSHSPAVHAMFGNPNYTLKELAPDEVGVGSIIKIKDLSDGEVETYRIGSSTESDPDNGIISDESPIGKAALRKKAGDKFDVSTPSGLIEFEIVEVKR